MACARLASVEIPDKVVSIGKQAFFSCVALEEVDLPDSLTYVADNAFENCPSLTGLPDLSGLSVPE